MFYQQLSIAIFATHLADMEKYLATVVKYIFVSFMCIIYCF
jgi:hypothetical protein